MSSTGEPDFQQAQIDEKFNEIVAGEAAFTSPQQPRYPFEPIVEGFVEHLRESDLTDAEIVERLDRLTELRIDQPSGLIEGLIFKADEMRQREET